MDASEEGNLNRTIISEEIVLRELSKENTQESNDKIRPSGVSTASKTKRSSKISLKSLVSKRSSTKRSKDLVNTLKESVTKLEAEFSPSRTRKSKESSTPDRKSKTHSIQDGNPTASPVQTIIKSKKSAEVPSNKWTLDDEFNYFLSGTESDDNSYERSSLDGTQRTSTDDDDVTLRLMFIKAFSNLPRISEMSIPLSDDIRKAENQQKGSGRVLEGSDSVQQDDYDNTEGTVQSEVQEEEYLGDENSSTTSSMLSLPSSFLESDDDTLSDPRPEEKSEVETEDIFAKMSILRVRGSLINFTDSDNDSENLGGVAYQLCEHFLNQLIEKAVGYCEMYSVKLPRSLDKLKLMELLSTLMWQYTDEKGRSEKLHKIVAEYYFRKKRMHYILAPNHADTVSEARFVDAIVDLDRFLKRRKETQALCNIETSDLRERAEMSRQRLECQIYHFEQVVKETLLAREGFDRLSNVVIDLLKRMAHLRNELADVRLSLINSQHHFADILNKSEKMEDLGNGLKLQEYFTKQTEVQILSRKIEERNADLKRLSNKINYDVHSMAHMKCKEQMVLSSFHKLKSKLKVHDIHKDFYRQRIYKEKLLHNKLLKELKEVKSEGCLMHYPALMRDYDDTKNYIDLKQNSVLKLRQNHDHLTTRIRQIEERQLAKISIAQMKKLPQSTSQEWHLPHTAKALRAQ